MSLNEEKGKPEKKMFSVRLNQKLIAKLNKLSGELGVSKAILARSYLQLSYCVLVEPNLDLTTFTKKGLSIFPTEILKEFIDSQDVKKQISLGDKLGIIINNNFQIMGLKNLEEKRRLIHGLNWIKFTPVKLLVDDEVGEEEDSKSEEIRKINKQFWGIPKDSWPILVIHAMLFRLIYNQEYNSLWKLDLLNKFLSQKDKKQKVIKNLKKNSIYYKTRDFISKFANEIGSHKENFEAQHNYYYFDVLRIEEE